MKPASDLLEQAIAFCRQGRFAEGVKLFRKALAVAPDHAGTHNLLGRALKELGRSDQALQGFDRAIALAPDFAEAHFNRGNLLGDQKRLEEAVASYDRAVALAPDFSAAWCNRGVTLYDLNRHQQAIASYDRALALTPDFAEAHSNRGNALKVLERLVDAVASYDRALKLRPDFAEAHTNRGAVLHELERYEEALASHDRALALKPDYAEAHFNRGNALKALTLHQDAIASYERALALKPNLIEALNNLGNLLIFEGKPMEALNVVRRALAIQETVEIKSLFVACAIDLPSCPLDDDFRDTVLRAISEPWARPSELIDVAMSLINSRGVIGKFAELETQRSSILAALSEDRLLQRLLESTPILGVEMERFLTAVRFVLLETAAQTDASSPFDKKRLNFYCALARQCFINEYVFACTDEESEKALRLRESMTAALASGAPVPALWLVAVAAYFPLHSLPAAPSLLERSWPDCLNGLLTQQVRESDEERQLRSSMPRLTAIESSVSLAVQQQYEDNPYPRWVKTAIADNPKSIDAHMRKAFPFVPFRKLGKASSLDILIAGCGTGQHSIETALEFKGAEVLAVDLSLASLCYAKNKTRALGLNNIEYAQADILNLGSIGRTFDLIEAGGVLHHLADPLAGWRILVSLLRPAGLMRLGFYSELARRNVVAVQNFIAERGYRATAEDIRICRQDIMALGDNLQLKSVMNSLDFFSLSACRDMLFHVQEHRLTLPEIGRFLAENNLQFLGFGIWPKVLRKYSDRFPEDKAQTNLDLWHIFEQENPDTFIGMYQFWVQKRINSSPHA